MMYTTKLFNERNPHTGILFKFGDFLWVNNVSNVAAICKK
ncbi:hypothetical protein VRK_29050 [Vibrio sp. MEBiC08052]|nr:hypothetical protein VRK_29050 [Vibrio sp. MEBiC08052]